ncbi:MAG TPA: LysR family transcriptional regulator [Edaphobacter sp.]|nr:LysR family transcriptional regulator [Edaphobacter sp.]
MTDLNELQFFVRVSQVQSFTLAAKHLGVPKSSVSRAISRLEGRLGVRLVERTTRSVALTEIGELYLEHCRRVLEEAEQADLVISTLVAKPRGTLRVGAPVAFARSILGPVLGEFVAAYPELRVHLQLLGGESSAREKNFDLIIRTGPLEDSSLLVKPLMRIRLGAYASPLYLKHHNLPDSPAALRQQSCITSSCGTFGEPGDSAIWRLRRGSEVKEVRIESRVSVPDPTINHQLALAGVGVALLSQVAARADLEHGRLVRLLPEWEPDPVELHALYPSRLNSSPKVRAFLQFLRQRFEGESLLDGHDGRIENANPPSRKIIKIR